MPVEDIVQNHDLLAKVMSHYRHLLERLAENSQTKSVMSNAMKENLAFHHTVKEIEKILSIKGAKATDEAKAHEVILTRAISLYVKDLEAVLDEAKRLLPHLPEGDLHRLETELRTVKAYLTG